MALFDDGGAAAAGISAIGNMFNSAVSSRRAWKYTQRAMDKQFELNKRAQLEYYGNARKSLVDAGYNPLLAVGSGTQGFSAGSAMSPVDSSFGSEMVNSALMAKKNKSDIKLQESQEDVNDANATLSKEQAETEKSKRVQMDFQNAMTDVQTHLAQKDLDTYDRRFYSNLYEQFQRAENYRANSAVQQMNAQTERMNAETNRMNYFVNSKNSAISAYNARTDRYNSETNRYNAQTNRYNAQSNRYDTITNRNRKSGSVSVPGLGSFSYSYSHR